MSEEPLKDGPEKSRARKEPLLSPHLQKVIKKAAQIADLMTDKDVAQDLKVLRQAKRATHQIFDTQTKKLKKVPDHKTRLAATTLSRAYHEGKPIERSIALHGDADDFAAMLEKARNSPAALESLQKTVEGKEITLEMEDSPGEQEPGAETKS